MKVRRLSVLFVIFIFFIFLNIFGYSEDFADESNITINEIMYNPRGSYTKEYIELFLNPIINLSGYKIRDNIEEDELRLLKFSNSSYVLIIQSGFNYTGINASIYDTTDEDIGRGLNNNGDNITIKNSSGYVFDSFNYSNQLIANGNGMSLCRLNNSWYECNPTPGAENTEGISGNYSVSRVIDGDTFVLSNNERVRLIGIDTPEQGEYYYEESKARLTELVNEKNVTLERDIENKDRYNRLLRYVYINDSFVNLILTEEGYARSYPYEPNTKYRELFDDAENEARENGKGRWNISFDGNLSEINTNMENLTIILGNLTNGTRTFIFMENNETIIIFNFSGHNLNLSNITIRKQTSNDFGYMIINGINLTENNTKTVYVDDLNQNVNSICIKDSEIISIDEISANCNNENEILITCDGGNNNGYVCNDLGNKYEIMGLKHSGVIERAVITNTGDSNPTDSGGGPSIKNNPPRATQEIIPEYPNCIGNSDCKEGELCVSTGEILQCKKIEEEKATSEEENSDNEITGAVTGFRNLKSFNTVLIVAILALVILFLVLLFKDKGRKITF